MAHQEFDVEENQMNRKEKWFYSEAERIEQEKQLLENEKAEIARQKKELSSLKREIERQKFLDSTFIEREKKLFDSKWKILERELHTIAAEKTRLEKEKAFYKQVLAFEQKQEYEFGMYFRGVRNEKELKKRYKDLVKIFHPDNICGDKEMIQVITQEYDSLKANFER